MTKKLILLTTLLLAFACSKDEEGETFLDKYDGTSWAINSKIITFSNGEYFYNYYNSDNIELIEWEGGEIEIINCVQYREGVIEYEPQGDYEVEIEANEPNKLVFTINFRGEILYRIKFVPESENLLMSESLGDWFDFPHDSSTTHILTKSDQSYSDFCN